MKLNLKIGIVGVVAAALVAIGAFGLGRAPNVMADVQAANVYILSEHVIESAPASATALYSCSAGPGALLVNKTNFPNTAILGSSGSTTIASMPLVVIPRGTTIFICVNTTAFYLSQNSGGNGVNTGTINYHTVGGAAAVANDEDGDISFDSNDVGAFTQPSCTNVDGDTRVGEVADDFCINATGTGTDHLVIPDANNNLNTVIVTFGCPSAVTPSIAAGALAFPITIQQDAGSFQFLASCRGEASTVTISATPTTVEIIPARSNTSHSLIQVNITDVNGFPILPGRDVDFATSICSIEEESVDSMAADTSGAGLNYARALVTALNTSSPASYAAWEFDLNPGSLTFTGGGTTAWPVDAVRASDKSDSFDELDLNVDGVPDRSVAAAILGCNPVDAPGAVPGVANITACVEVFDGADICVGVSVTVVGPPASITVAASPTSLRCGEKSTVTATVKDSIGQNVSDHTRVEWVTNLGGVIGGTGAVAGGAGLVSPISSSVGDTFGGVATAFLITSEVTTGPYEVIATSGGTTATDWAGFIGGVGTTGVFTGTFTYTFQPAITVLGGVFSTPPVSAQVTVTCALPAAPAAAAPAITAPRTGTGITPPNTGDAGLVSSSSSNWALFAIGGIFALTLAGFATLKAARR